MGDALRMSQFIEYRAAAEMRLAHCDTQGTDKDQYIAAANAYALLTLAEAVRDVANAIRETPGSSDRRTLRESASALRRTL